MLHFRVPVSENDLWLEVFIKQLVHVVSMKLPVIAEGFQQSGHFLYAHIGNVVLQLGCPEVNAIQGALIALVVAPEGTERIPATHTLLWSCRVELLKLFVHGGIKKVGLCHVVD